MTLNARASAVTLLLCSFIACLVRTKAGWVDIDTPLEKRETNSFIDGTPYQLVMSDEFNVDGRTFKDGHDPMWTALDKSDDDSSSAGGGSLHFYNSSAVSTENGMLKIQTYREKTQWNHYDPIKKEWKKVQTNFTSGMVQSWNKFCFTGGILEVDVIFPGDPSVGGLWPAIWLLGNLGRATYEASTNRIWPFSYNKCDRELQDAQAISACNKARHFGMNENQGRGATEIDLVEVMTGDSNGPFKVTDPPISLPYADLTLQVAPGVDNNRPQSGGLPLKKDIHTRAGYTLWEAQTWYKGLEMNGNTSINPFFYGTYLAETKPEEPVYRSADQAFQADAVGTVHQLTRSHFEKPHTFRLEWQPGRGGRLDWFVKTYTVNNQSVEGDGRGQDWVRAFTIKDESLENLMGTQIPNEPSYLIMNTAVSSTWGFPYDIPDYCTSPTYDCNDPKSACAFDPGFCEMLRHDVAMYIDSVRVYQTQNDSAHVGSPHTLGCDPPGYPTKDWIEGHEYRYMRNPPFSYKDSGPLKRVQRGGGRCKSDFDCGADVHSVNFTAMCNDDNAESGQNYSIDRRGQCAEAVEGWFSTGQRCYCDEGFTGPFCLAMRHWDSYPSAQKLSRLNSPFSSVAPFQMTWMLKLSLLFLAALFVFIFVFTLNTKRHLLKDVQYLSIQHHASETIAFSGGSSDSSPH